MTPEEKIAIYAAAVSAVSTVVTAVAACVAAYTYHSQAREMRLQSRLLTKSVEGSNLLRLIVDVLDDDARHSARKRMMVLWTEGVPLERWTEADRRDGERVVRTFDLMGMMVRRGLLDHDLVVQTWGIRIMQMHSAVYSLLAELRERNGPTYMSHFDWLEREARSAVGHEHRVAVAAAEAGAAKTQEVTAAPAAAAGRANGSEV